MTDNAESKTVRPSPEFDARKEVDGTLATWADMEAEAWKELRLLTEPSVRATMARLKCINTIHALRETRLKWLLGLGWLDAIGPAEQWNVDDAVQIRDRLRRLAVVTEDDLISDGERAWLGMRPRKRGRDDGNTSEK